MFALTNEAYAVYLPAANGQEVMNLRDASASFKQRWFNPQTGEFTQGDTRVAGASSYNLGSPPSRQGEDWVVLLTRSDQAVVQQPEQRPGEAPQFNSVPSPTVSVGEQFSITLTASDSDGTFPSVTVGQLPPGMRIEGPGNGQLELTWTVTESAAAASIVELVAIDATDSSLRTMQSMTINVVGGGDLTPSDNTQSGGTVVENLVSTNTESDSSNAPPVLRSVPTLTIQVGQRLSQRIVADDADGVPPSLNMSNAPEGSTLDDNGDGTRSFNRQPTAADTVSRVVTFIAKDSAEPTLSDTLEVEILVTP